MSEENEKPDEHVPEQSDGTPQDELYGHHVDLHLREDEIVTDMIVIVQTQSMNDFSTSVRYRAGAGTSRLMAEALVFNVYHSLVGEIQSVQSWEPDDRDGGE